MKFSTLEERESLLKSFSEKADSLTVSMLKERSIPNKTKVIFETITNWDEGEFLPILDEENNPVLIDGEIQLSSIKSEPSSGDILVAYIRQPQLLNGTEIMDILLKKGEFQAGLKGFDSMVLLKHSSPEVEDQDIKFGICWRLAKALSIRLHDLKKN